MKRKTNETSAGGVSEVLTRRVKASGNRSSLQNEAEFFRNLD